jgi:hypothetical protein
MSTDYIYQRAISDDLELEYLVDVLKLAHYWDMEDLHKEAQSKLVDMVSLGTWEYSKSARHQWLLRTI